MDESDFELDDIIDQAEQTGKLTPREYSKARGMNPQLLYYYIRTGKVEVELCACGRKVVDVRNTDKVLETKAAARGAVLDTRSDAARGPRGGKEG